MKNEHQRLIGLTATLLLIVGVFVGVRGDRSLYLEKDNEVVNLSAAVSQSDEEGEYQGFLMYWVVLAGVLAAGYYHSQHDPQQKPQFPGVKKED